MMDAICMSGSIKQEHPYLSSSHLVTFGRVPDFLSLAQPTPRTLRKPQKGEHSWNAEMPLRHLQPSCGPP